MRSLFPEGKLTTTRISQETIRIMTSLKDCTKQKDLDKGIRVHADIVERGCLAKDCYVASSLVNMYVRCGALAKAAGVLEQLSIRDVVIWNSLIAGYAQAGQLENVLNCIEQMHLDGIPPNAVTFSCIFKACGSIGAVDKGEQIHNEVVKQGLLQKDVVLGSSLVDMYVKCGALEKAALVLGELPVRNVVTWSALITGYAQAGKGKVALKCFEQMQREGISPNLVTLSCVLNACGRIGAVDKGEQIHMEIENQGLLAVDAVLGTAVMDMYVKCGALTKAAQVHDALPARNVVSWNSLIAGYIENGQGVETLKCFEKMQCEGVCPNIITFVYMLKTCISLGEVVRGEQILKDSVKWGLLGKDVVLDSTVVDMYAKCGPFVKAVRVFDELPVRNVVSWNAVIAGYTQQLQSEEALNCFAYMQWEGISPDITTYIYVLKACGSTGALIRGAQVHNEIIRAGWLKNENLLGSTLIAMYARCGAFEKALQVLDELPDRNVTSWNALISGYSQHEQGNEAWECFQKMQDEGHIPDIVTYVCILKACSSIGAVDDGEKIHDIITKELLDKNITLGNSLVDMYAKCGKLVKASAVLDKLPVRDVASWNSLITGYAQQGLAEEAWQCFSIMQCEGLSPNMLSFMCVLKVCGSFGACFYREVVRHRLLGKDIALENPLVDMYDKFGALSKLLDNLPIRDILSCNAIIAGYVQQGENEEALKYFKQMLRIGPYPNSITFTFILKACSNMGLFEEGENVHTQLSRKGLVRKDTILATSLLDMYVGGNQLAKAERVLDELSVRDVISWNTLISGYARHGHGVDAINCFRRMQIEALSSDTGTIVSILKACGAIGAADKGERIHNEILNQGLLGKDAMLGSAVVDMYMKCGELTRAVQVLDALSARNVVTWNALIAGYVQWGWSEEALKCFQQMHQEGCSPNAATFNCILRACGNTGALHKGEQIHEEIISQGLLMKDIFLRTTLVGMYAKCGKAVKIGVVLDDLLVGDLVFWNVMIARYALWGQGMDALRCFEQMQDEGLSPDTMTLLNVLGACSRSGLIDEGQACFEDMNRKFGITPGVEHYTCMVVLYGRVGEFDKALTIIKQMSSSEHLPLWLALLSACQEWGNTKFGRIAFNNAVLINEKDAAAYTLMAKTYIAAGMKENAKNIIIMRERSIKEINLHLVY